MLQPAARHTFLMKNVLHRQSQPLLSFMSTRFQSNNNTEKVNTAQTADIFHKHLLRNFQFTFSFNECIFSVEGAY